MAIGKLIQIEDAKLKTLTVEIKSLVINGKQMTLAVFRQLPEESIFDDEMNLRGVPWGLVRYRIDGNNNPHVLWQNDDVLFRYQIRDYPPISTYKINKLQDEIRGKIEQGKKYLISYNHTLEEYERREVRKYYSEEDRVKDITMVKHNIKAQSDEISTLTDSLLPLNSQESEVLEMIEIYEERLSELLELPQLFIAV